MAKLTYDSNNSGGGWWLTDEDWYALERAGWKVNWYKDYPKEYLFGADENGRWLGALASGASFETDDREAAIAQWAEITGQDPDAEGCDCCGQPHYFYLED